MPKPHLKNEQRLTRRALFRERRGKGDDRTNDRLRSAVRSVATKIIKGWKEPATESRCARPIDTPDDRLVRTFGLDVRTDTVVKFQEGRAVEVVRHRLKLPPWIDNMGTAFHWMIVDRIHAAPAAVAAALDQDRVDEGAVTDAVVEGFLPGGRPIYMHSFLERAAHVLTLRPLITRGEQRLPKTVHSYRPRRSRFTALHAVAEYVRQGFRFAQRGDILQFFPSINKRTLILSLESLFPEITLDYLGLVESCMSPSAVLRRPNNKNRTSPGKEHYEIKPGLLQGSAIAPYLSNVVGAFVIDVPIRDLHRTDVVALRYSDDFLVLGRSPEACRFVMRLIAERLDAFDLTLHPDPEKTMAAPVDVFREPVTWLGKAIHGRSIVTPTVVLDHAIGELLQLDAVTRQYQRRVRQVLDELTLDRAGRLEYFRDRLRKAGHRDALRDFDLARPGWLDPRKRDQPADSTLEGLYIEADDA